MLVITLIFVHTDSLMNTAQSNFRVSVIAIPLPENWLENRGGFAVYLFAVNFFVARYINFHEEFNAKSAYVHNFSQSRYRAFIVVIITSVVAVSLFPMNAAEHSHT